MIFDLSDVHTFLKSKIVNHQTLISFLVLYRQALISVIRLPCKVEQLYGDDNFIDRCTLFCLEGGFREVAFFQINLGHFS